jgi:hypothetical protein
MHPFFLALFVRTALAEELLERSPQRKGTMAAVHSARRRLHPVRLRAGTPLPRWNRNRGSAA